jgi:tRNA(Ile)-lysidine synthase
VALNWFEAKVWRFFEQFELRGESVRILLAVSGGADSMALLECFKSFAIEGLIGGGIFCGHVNHSLRGLASDGDETFVIEQCGVMGVGVESRRIDVRGYAESEKLSIETAAREMRRAELLGMAGEAGCCVIATAHHADDNAETMLHRLLRGTGLRGLAGIRAERELDGSFFISPLLCVSRSEIERYLNEKGAGWRSDITNQDVRYTRNFIRHCLVGAIDDGCGESLVELLGSLSGWAGKLRRKVEDEADVIWRDWVEVGEKVVTVEAEGLCETSELVGVEVVRRCLVRVGCGERNVTAGHYKDCYGLFFENVSGKELALPGCDVRREYGSVIFSARDYESEEGERCAWEISMGGEVFFGGYVCCSEILKVESVEEKDYKSQKPGFVEFFDADKIEGALCVLSYDGDLDFVPLGMRGAVKIKRFLDARKIGRDKRSRILVVRDSKKVIWVWPLRVSEQVRIDGDTKNIVRMEISEHAAGGDAVSES